MAKTQTLKGMDIRMNQTLMMDSGIYNLLKTAGRFYLGNKKGQQFLVVYQCQTDSDIISKKGLIIWVSKLIMSD